jgi:hypothetical protein
MRFVRVIYDKMEKPVSAVFLLEILGKRLLSPPITILHH